MTLSSLAGLTLTAGTGSGDTTMTFTGTLDAINADLNGLRFDPTAGFTGAAVVGISTNDLGNTGAGGPQTDAQSVLVAVGGPLVAVDTQATTDENTPVEVDVLATDAFVHGDQLTLSLVSGPANGQAVVNSNGTPGYETITYTPSAYFSGTDSFVYQVSDGYGNSATATVTLTVNPVDYALINVPPDQVSAEGETVALPLATPNNTTGVPLTFAAVGLPAGLTIDPHTGIIGGIPLYSDAETNAGQSSVTVTATGPGQGDSDTESFNWSISDTNRIGLIDDQVNEAGQSVSLQPVVQDNLGEQLTFSVTGLPAGLSIDPNTGRIYGTVAAEAPGITTFAVTFQVRGGGATDTQTFNWQVVSGSGEHVLFAINDTLRIDDDVTLVDPQTPLPVRVTLFAPGTQGPQAVYLEVPSGLATLDTYQLQLSDGQSAEVVLTPQQASVQADDVVLVAYGAPNLQQLIGLGTATVLKSIEIGTGTNVGKIRAANTPAGFAATSARAAAGGPAGGG